MDIINSCEEIIDTNIQELKRQVAKNASQSEDEVFAQTQTAAEVSIADKDKNLDRILDQQAHVKMIIERDGRIKALQKAIVEDKRVIDILRKSCARISMNALKNRQELLETHAKEREKFQMQQLKSIAEDYRRHQEILELRKKEILSLKRETENEESNRESYLADVEKNLDKQLQNRQQLHSNSGFSGGGNRLTDELNNPAHIELTSIDEYAPYGTAPHSRIGNGGGAASGRRGGSGRGRKRKQAS